MRDAYLLEANVIGVLSEALSAQVQSVFPDDTMLIGTGAAETNYRLIRMGKTKMINCGNGFKI